MELRQADPILTWVLLGVSFFLLLGVGFYSRIAFDPAGRGEALPDPPLAVAVSAQKQLGDEAALVEFRWNRDRERSRLQETLEEMLRTAEGEQRTKLHDELLTLMKRQTVEHELENLLAAKGYPQNAVAVYPGTVAVIVKGRPLNPAAVAEIGELATRITGYRVEQIRIME
ncbi:MAG: SpoIIIAH-like family protein [Firmicutes bacterium]|nr:SpoIIIAH-like family protein [Bacillota bacterium]